MQFVVPIVITMGVFGAHWAENRKLSRRRPAVDAERRLYLGTVPIFGHCAAWFGMNDIADAKASFRNSRSSSRKHNWIMCVLYTGTFGSSSAIPQVSRC